MHLEMISTSPPSRSVPLEKNAVLDMQRHSPINIHSLQGPDWSVMEQRGDLQEGYEKGLNGGTTAAECPCDETAACHTPASQRVWTNWISPSLLLLAMCIHGIFEGLVLGLQVRLAVCFE